jgi:hypothetical protein
MPCVGAFARAVGLRRPSASEGATAAMLVPAASLSYKLANGRVVTKVTNCGLHSPAASSAGAKRTQMTQTISDDYRQQQMTMHENPSYGRASVGFAPIVKNIMANTGAKSLSDYGAGKCRLRDALIERGAVDFDYFPYDPAFPDYGPPKAADLVTCIDVLEHIEEPYLDNVLGDLKAITRNLGLFSIHCGPAKKVLPDGRNAHLIQAPTSWWLPRLCQYFEIARLNEAPGGFWVVVKPLSARVC